MKKLFFFLALISLLTFSASIAIGGTQSTFFTVTAETVVACTVTATPLDFGLFDGTSYTPSTSTISVTCPLNLPYQLAVDSGLHNPDPTQDVRYMTDPTETDLLQYILEVGPDPVGDGCMPVVTNPKPCLPFTGTGAVQDHNVNGGLFADPDIVVGVTYSDTVTVTVLY